MVNHSVASLLAIVAAMPCVAMGEEQHAPQKAFAYLLFGEYADDPCANTSAGKINCPPRFSDRRMDYADDKAQQTYVFEANPCIVHATTRIAQTGKTYEAEFRLQNVLYVNLNGARQEGSLMEVEFFLQGKKVLEADGKTGNVLVVIHKYFATASGDIGHAINAEAVRMRKAMKAYQNRFCPAMG